MNARADFLTFLAEASGTHAFALSALQISRRRIESLPIINPDNPDPVIAGVKGTQIFQGILSRVRDGGEVYSLIIRSEAARLIAIWVGQITLVFDRWEDDFRHRFAKEMGVLTGR